MADFAATAGKTDDMTHANAKIVPPARHENRMAAPAHALVTRRVDTASIPSPLHGRFLRFPGFFSQPLLQAMYASYRSESLLTTRVAGMDQAVVTVRNKKPAAGNRGASPVWW